ncbi:MAG: hypothetical protein BIFFINMI_04231 [Phycisphaerae bacterium]|nr:hypothetical protein [Phycisphaerae bacterium]
MTRRFNLAAVAVLACCGALSPARGQEEAKLADFLPADAVVSYIYDPAHLPEGVAMTEGMTNRLIRWADRTGLVPDSGKVVANLATAAPVFASRPHAISLIDFSARTTPRDRHVMAAMRLAIVFWAPDGDDDIRRALMRIFADYFYGGSEGPTTIAWQQAGKWKFQRIHDKRMPAWLRDIEVGRIGKAYVIGLGRGSFEAIADAAARPETSLGRNAWYVRQMEAVIGRRAMSVYCDWLQVSRRIEGIIPGRADAIAGAFDTPHLEHFAWALSFSGRKLYSRLFYEETGKPTGRLDLSNPDDFTPEQVARMVPAGAHYYGAARLPIGKYVARLQAAMELSLSAHKKGRLSDGWKKYAGQLEFAAVRRLFDTMGPEIWIHDWPVHPMRLPGAVTIVTQVRDEPAARRDTAAVMSVLDHWLQAKSQGSKLARLEIRKDPEAPAWWLQFGLMGPAMRYADAWMILSWSPEAARLAAEELAGK